MKKVLFILISIIAIATTANAQKLFSKEWRLQQLGRDSASVAQRDQEIYVKIQKEVTVADINGIVTAGKLLKKSANYQYGATACFIAGGGLAVGAAYMDKKSSRNTMLCAGGGLAVVGLVLQIKAINYKFKSGNILELTGDKIVLKF